MANNKHLSFLERLIIEQMLKNRDSFKAIARELEKSVPISFSKRPGLLESLLMTAPSDIPALFPTFATVLNAGIKSVLFVRDAIFIVRITSNILVPSLKGLPMSATGAPYAIPAPWKNTCILLMLPSRNTNTFVRNPDLASVFRRRRLSVWITSFLHY